MKHTDYRDTRMRWLPLMAMISLVGGCSVTGTWKRVTTDPPNALFPVDDLLLDRDGNYNARWEHEGRKYGSYGTYEFRGGELIVAQAGSMPRAYGARIRLDGKLELTVSVNGDSVRAVLERQQPPKEEPAGQGGQSETPPDRNEAAPAKPIDAGNGNREH